MFIIISCELDGHNGLGHPDTTTHDDLTEVKEELLNWAGDRSGEWFRVDDEDLNLLALTERVKAWDGKVELRIEEEDGPYIQVTPAVPSGRKRS